MATSQDPSSRDNTYILGHTYAEQVRLVEQDRHFTQGMGGLLPEQTDLSAIHRVLDVACGPGGWALELAQERPRIQVVGIDIDAGMIDYAIEQARASGLDNASFRVMNALDPLDFPDAFFDLVNARFMVGFLPTTTWPQIIQEFLRITRKGGIIRLTESEWGGTTTSASYERSLSFTIRAMQRVGQSFSPDGRHVGITPMIRRFLQDAGCLNIQEQAHALDFSVGTAAHQDIMQDLWIAQKLLQPFHMGVAGATQQDVDQIYQKIPVEMLSDEFCGILYLLTVWGERP